MVVLDEAYVDFAEDDCWNWRRERPNVMVLRTLSKGYSLAGLRLGFAVAKPNSCWRAEKVKDTYNVDAVAIAVGGGGHGRPGLHGRQRREGPRRAGDGLPAELAELGFGVWPSEANFLLARVPPGGDGRRDCYQALKARGILVRYFHSEPRLDDKLADHRRRRSPAE